MLSDKALKNVQACISLCDELICGRFIFAENIISQILQRISESDEIYNLIAECMKNFNFDKEFNKAKVKMPTKDGYFIMPESKATILPLVFCILVDIRDRKINFNDFLKTYFKCDDCSEFENFSKTVIVPFKDTLIYCFELDKITPIEEYSLSIEEKDNQKEDKKEIEDEPESKEFEEEERVSSRQDQEKTNSFLMNVKLVAKQMLQELNTDKHLKSELKDDAIYLLNCLTDCAEGCDIKNLSAYIVSLGYVVKPIKSLRFLIKEMRQYLIDYYD